MRDLAKEFETTNIEANTFATNIFNYEKRLGEITQNPEDWQQPSTVYKKFRLRTLQSKAQTIRWIDLLQAHFTSITITDKTQVLVAFPEYFERLAQLISATDNT